MQSELTKKEQRLMRRWFRKTDENTIELKEKRWGWIKIILGIILMGGIYHNFIAPNHKEWTWRNLELTFQPNKWAERQYEYEVSDEDPNLTRWGETKEEFLISMKEHRREKAGLIIGYIYFLTSLYIFSLVYFLWPAKRRVRFDRKRSIIYTSVNNKFYLTEMNKLMRPFPEYIINTGAMVIFWVHPYEYPHKINIFRRGSQMMVSDYTMWLPMLGMIFTLNRNLYKRSSAAILKRFLVEFMNPDTPPERIAGMMKALETRLSICEYLEKILFGWIDSGLYCRGLPKDEVLETEIEKYFTEQAPKIKALPSCSMRTEPREKITLKSGFLTIETVELNRALGFKRVPYKNLYEYPKRSMHSGGFIGGWGNELEDGKYSDKDDLLS